MNQIQSHHTSVDCVVLGFDGEKLKVLLIRRNDGTDSENFHDMKLPGSLIYADEDLDDAARRVMSDITGLKNIFMHQFKAFGALDRTSNPEDVKWLERAQKVRVGRIVTVGYFSLVRIDKALIRSMENTEALWLPVNDLPPLAFDHNIIIREAVSYLRTIAGINPGCMYELLPRKFTISQLRSLYEVVFGKKIDAGNFYKKMAQRPYVVPVGEKQVKVSHRAAMLYKFDRTIYNKMLP